MRPVTEPTSPPQPLDDRELETLDTLLCGLASESAMNVEAMDGFVTALVVGPRLVARLQRADWLPVVWGGAPFASGKQRKRAEMLVQRHLQAVEYVLRSAPDTWEPIFSIAEAPDGSELVDAGDWCAGFLQAVALDAEAWSSAFDDPALEPLALLGGDEAGLDAAQRERLQSAEQRDALSRAVPDAVLTLV
jgi:uncharacterized protein